MHEKTIILFISAIFLLSACGNEDNEKVKNNLMTISSKKNQVQLKKLPPIKMFKAIIIERFYHLKKVKRVVYYKIIWQIVITVKILKTGF